MANTTEEDDTYLRNISLLIVGWMIAMALAGVLLIVAGTLVFG
jgi:hypothetical protein